MKHHRILSLGFLFVATSFAQGAVPFDFYTAVKQDSVIILTTRTLRAGENILVERKAPTDQDFHPLTETPIEADMDPFSAREQLGGMYPVIAEATHTTDPQSALLALRTDDFYGMVFSLLDHRVASVLGRYFAASGHQIGQVYTYKLTLRERDGKALATMTHSVTIRETPPGDVPKLSAEQSGNHVHLSWNYPDWSGVKTDLAIRFHLERKEASGQFIAITDKILPRIGEAFYHYDDDAVHEGGAYTYRIKAIDVAGLSGPWSQEVSITVRDIAPPSKPRGLVAEVSGKSVLLSWQPNLELDLSHYDVYRMELEKADSIRINDTPLSPDRTEFADVSIVYKHTYYYSIVAVDTSGNESPPSDVAHALATDTTPPEAPTGLTATVKERTVILLWHPARDNDLAGYRVSRSMNDRTFFPVHPDLVQDTMYVDTGPEGKRLEPGWHYYYAVKAIDSLANASGPAGIWITIPDDEPPQPPGQVVVENQHGRHLKVSWSPSPSHDVARYRLIRIDHKSEKELGTLPGALRIYQDDSVSTGESVLYAVSAIDTAGNESVRKWSFPETLRDFDPPPAPRYIEAAWIENAVKVQWDPIGSTDLAGYNVYRSDLPTGMGEKLNQGLLQVNSFIDAKGTKENWYWVRSLDSSGNEGEKSRAVSAPD